MKQKIDLTSRLNNSEDGFAELEIALSTSLQIYHVVAATNGTALI